MFLCMIGMLMNEYEFKLFTDLIFKVQMFYRAFLPARYAY